MNTDMKVERKRQKEHASISRGRGKEYTFMTVN